MHNWRGRRAVAIATAMVGLGLGTATADAAVGDRDPDFNGGDKVTVQVAGPSLSPYRDQQPIVDATVDANGRTTTTSTLDQQAGSGDAYETRSVLTRITNGGAIDTSFGIDGKVRINSLAGSVSVAGMSLFTDAAGRLGGGFDLDTDGKAAVRFGAGGVRDDQYGGPITGDPGGDPGVAQIPDPSGGIVHDTSAGGADGSTYFADTDTIFNTGSTTSVRIAKVDPDGRRVAGYAPGPQPFLVPRNGTNGVKTVALVDGQDRLLLVRQVTIDGIRQFSVMRFTAAGALDTSWAGDGRAEYGPTTNNPTRNFTPFSAALAPDGKVVVAGTWAGPGSNFGLAVMRIRDDGTLDPGFGTGGMALVSQAFTGLAVAVQPDGKVVTAGGDQLSRLQLHRFTAAGQLDPTFSGDGVVLDTIVPTAQQPVRPSKLLIGSGPRFKLTVAGSIDADALRSRGFVSRYLLQDASLAPDNTAPPQLSGTPREGSQLSCAAGTWTNNPTLSVVWERAPRNTASDSDPGWTPVVSGPRTYTVTATDVGSRLRCREIATNGNGTDSAPSRSLRADAGVPVLLRAPTMSGVPVVGNRMQCDTGQWANGPDLSVRWLRNGQEIRNAEGNAYTLSLDDRRARVACQVGAANDIGPAAAPARSANDALVVLNPPAIQSAPSIALSSTGAKATDQRLTCGTGQWDEDYGQYDYRWEREGAEIAGATAATYSATAADLGRLVRCVVSSTNPKGVSEGARSEAELVPLPATGEAGAIYTAGAFNRLDPANFMAVTKAWRDKISTLVLQRRTAAAESAKADCRSGGNADAPLPNFGDQSRQARILSARETCGVLLRAPASQVVYPTGEAARWIGGSCSIIPVGGLFGKFTPVCPTLRLNVPVLNASSPPSAISQLEQASLAEVKPIQVLWDFDQDGRTDASCDPDAPVLRTLPSQGIYNIRAVIVSADSEATGLYSVTDLTYRFHPGSNSQKGQLRDAQPFACKTSLNPPPEPTQPCITEATVGRTHIEGNVCPVSARRIPDADLGGLPTNVRKLLEAQAFAGPLRKLSATPAPLAMDHSYGLKAAPGSLSSVATSQVSALSSWGNARAAEVQKGWEDKLKASVPSFNIPEAQHAMDQIYLVRGAAKVNGVDFNPRNGALTVVVPSDAGKAVDGIKRMTLSNRDVQLALGGLPIGNPESLATDLQDKAKGYGEQLLKSANFDAMAKDLAKKLDLGPFKLGGDAKVKMQADGTALIEAQAQLKGPFKAGSGPIRTNVTIRATRAGKLSLQGVRLAVPRALLGGVTVSGLDLTYDGGGLNIKGKLLFPPVNDGVAINRFRTTASGEFQELDVSYLAGAGQGINIGPGIFLVKLGGGLSLNPDEIRARAGISMGPSPGGGCPTAGLDANLNVHFAPGVFFVDATSTVELVCIPLGNAHFYADATGLADISANVAADLGIVYFNAGLHGRIQLPRWQVDMRGRGGVRHVFSGEVKALIGNLGLAGCGRVEIFPETPFTDSVTVAGGAGIRFPNGRPPLTYPELLANISAFTGCSLTKWSPFGRDVASAAQAGGRTFTLGKDAPAVQALELTGSGGAPKVKVTTPDGKVLDASGFGTDLTKTADISGLRDEERGRTILFVRGAPGTWKVDPVDGSPRIADLRHAEVLPAPKVSAKVGGAGASRILRYEVAKVPGQVVSFVEQSRLGQRKIRTITGGGSGKVRFLTSEGKGTRRTVVAQVVQDGLPRDNLTVARFTAPNPRVAKPRVSVRRRGAKVTVKWRKAFYAKTYEVSVATGRGRRFLLVPKAGTREVGFGGLRKGEGAVVRVVGKSPGGKRGPARVVRVKGGLKVSSGPKKDRWDAAKKREKRAQGKRKRKEVPARRALG